MNKVDPPPKKSRFTPEDRAKHARVEAESKRLRRQRARAHFQKYERVPRMTESRLHRMVSTYCKDKGYFVCKITAQGKRGMPDLLIMNNGRVLFLELKAPGKKPTAQQESTLHLLRLHGAMAQWASNLDECIALIEYVCDQGH